MGRMFESASGSQTDEKLSRLTAHIVRDRFADHLLSQYRCQCRTKTCLKVNPMKLSIAVGSVGTSTISVNMNLKTSNRSLIFFNSAR